MNCIDVMIWIGQSYWKILCNSEKSCAIPARRKTHCYVHEAEWQGCCRKVPTLPKWIVPGQSKVFLAHQDNLKSKTKARIFGYFVLERTEVLTALLRKVPLPLQDPTEVEGRDGRKLIGKCWDGSRIVSHRYVKGKWVPTGDRGPEPPVATPCKDGEKLKHECWDKSFIVTHKCVNGEWVETNNKCPDPPFGGCKDGAKLTQRCPDGSIIVTHICVDGEWVSTHQRCPKRIPVHNTMFGLPRSCSLRLKPGGNYLVDARAAEVTDRFDEELQRSHIMQEYSDAQNDRDRARCIRKGHALFKRIVDEIAAKRRHKTRIPPKLRRKAKLRGELVLFNNPPIIERYPKAAFRSALRINGDSLIKQISDGVHIATIDYCDWSLTGQLATRLKTNKAIAKRFLKALSQIMESELEERGSVKLHDMCRFSVVGRKERKGRNPQTGETITIPARKVVKCSNFKRLSEAAERCSCVSLESGDLGEN